MEVALEGTLFIRLVNQRVVQREAEAQVCLMPLCAKR